MGNFICSTCGNHAATGQHKMANCLVLSAAQRQRRYRETQVNYWKNKTATKQEVKRELVALLGNSCSLCGYDKNYGALDFDHLDPATKTGRLAELINDGRFAEARKEVKKCRLLCKNCHAEYTWPQLMREE